MIKSSIDKDIESENLKILQTDANLKETENYEDIYIQVFSDEKNLTKIYLYKIDNVKKISVESMNIKRNKTKIQIFLRAWLTYGRDRKLHFYLEEI